MQRQLITIILFAMAAITIIMLWLYGGSVAPLPPQAVEPQQQTEDPGIAVAEGTVGSGNQPMNAREAVLDASSELLSDPDIRAGLCGFKGRVVSHLKVPVVDCGVRIYRGAMDSVMKEGADLFADVQDYEPKYIAGEVQTDETGAFLITGVWPRGIYLMFAGLGTDAPTHQLITKTPSPGQVVDLGDVVLNEAGVISGEVYDSDGEPIAGALVRAADIPGALAAFFPAERFDPEGAVLIREPRAPVQVLRMPPWVKNAFEHLPIPTTRTDLDGKFRLVGVMPGSNMLATTVKGFLSDVKPSIRVRSGQEKRVGRIRLREGEELYAKVLDQKGKPVVGAEVVAGSTLSMVPVDLASHLGVTNAAGEIEGTGFSPGKVTVAARRSKKDAWVLAKPQSIISDVIVTMPTQYGFSVAVQMADGSPCKNARFRLLRGKKGDGAAELFLLGMAQPVDLKDRLKKVEDGQWQVRGLNKGTYTMLAEVEGLATGSKVIELEEEDGQCLIKLEAPTLFSVLVVNQDDQPIANAAIFAEARGGKRLTEMPVNCGRTDKNGRLMIDKLQAESLRVSADHPLWGIVHGETKPDQELLLRLMAPGEIRGFLSENGKPPLPGKFTIACIWSRGSGPRGPLESTPQMTNAGLDGTFTISSLQPGKYWVTALSSLDVIRSPGSISDFAQSMFMNQTMANAGVDVISGQTAEVRLEVGKEPLEGPTAQLTGSVMVDGRVADGYTMVARGQKGRFAGVVDERGRFDLGVISAGDLNVSVSGSEGGMFMGRSNSIWSDNIKLAEGEQRDLVIDITTSYIAGTCYLPDGSPGAGVFISARGKLKSNGEARGSSRMNVVTEADGSFRMKQVPAGTWNLDFRGKSGDERWRNRIEKLEVGPGAITDSLRVELQAGLVVKGQIELAALPEKPRWGYLMFYRLTPSNSGDGKGESGRGVGYRGKGTFVTDELTAGRYRVVLNVRGKNRAEYECGELDVPLGGLTDVKLVPRIN